MRKSSVRSLSASLSTLALWGLFAAALGGAGLLWHGTSPPHPTAKPADTDDAVAEEAGVNPTRLLVDFKDDISPEALRATGTSSAGQRLLGDRQALSHRLRDADEARGRGAKLAKDPEVESVDYDSEGRSRPTRRRRRRWPSRGVDGGRVRRRRGASQAARRKTSPTTPATSYQWHLRQIGMPDAWKLAQGNGVIVAVIDTGVTKVGDLAETKFVPGYNFVANNANAADDHGHGTHVAGTIAQSTNNGSASPASRSTSTIMPIKVLSARGSGSVAGIAEGIRWAADHGAKVINMSLGGPMAVGQIGKAVKYAHDKGVVVVCAAGNDGRGKVSYPARYPGAIAVAATQFDETTTFYSNWGKEIDIAAPGGNTRVDQNGDGKPDGVLQNTIVPGNISHTDYLWFMGTSMASPHVAGVAALIVGEGVTKPDAVEKILLGTARAPKPRGQRRGVTAARSTTTTAPASSTRRRRCARRTSAAAPASSASAWRPALLGCALMRRRGIAARSASAAASWRRSSSARRACSALPFPRVVGAPGRSALLSSGFTAASPARVGWRGNPLIWSALLPVALTVLFYGMRRLRPALAGFGFGIAGALLFAAVSNTVDVRYVPDFLDRFWLLGQAAIAGFFAAVSLRKA